MIPLHWRLRGPSRANHARLLRYRNVWGGHVGGLYRIVRIGPFSLMLLRYSKGEVTE